MNLEHIKKLKESGNYIFSAKHNVRDFGGWSGRWVYEKYYETGQQQYFVSTTTATTTNPYYAFWTNATTSFHAS